MKGTGCKGGLGLDRWRGGYWWYEVGDGKKDGDCALINRREGRQIISRLGENILKYSHDFIFN